jgi:hypothetical protein
MIIKQKGIRSMKEEEIQVIEKAVKELRDIQTELTSIKTEIETRLDEIRHIEASLIRLLPNDKRINMLFQ